MHEIEKWIRNFIWTANIQWQGLVTMNWSARDKYFGGE